MEQSDFKFNRSLLSWNSCEYFENMLMIQSARMTRSPVFLNGKPILREDQNLQQEVILIIVRLKSKQNNI